MAKGTDVREVYQIHPVCGLANNPVARLGSGRTGIPRTPMTHKLARHGHKPRGRILYVEECKSVWIPNHRNKSTFAKALNRIQSALREQGAHTLSLEWNHRMKRFYIFAKRRSYAGCVRP